MGQSSAWMGKRLGTPGAAGTCSDTDAAKKRVDSVAYRLPYLWKYVMLFFFLSMASTSAATNTTENQKTWLSYTKQPQADSQRTEVLLGNWG